CGRAGGERGRGRGRVAVGQELVHVARALAASVEAAGQLGPGGVGALEVHDVDLHLSGRGRRGRDGEVRDVVIDVVGPDFSVVRSGAGAGHGQRVIAVDVAEDLQRLAGIRIVFIGRGVLLAEALVVEGVGDLV